MNEIKDLLKTISTPTDHVRKNLKIHTIYFFLHVNKFTQKILMKKKKLGDMLSGGMEGKNNELTMTTRFMGFGQEVESGSMRSRKISWIESTCRGPVYLRRTMRHQWVHQEGDSKW